GDGGELARRDVDRYRRLGRHRHPAVLAWAAAVARPAPAAARTRSRSAAVSVVAGIEGIADRVGVRRLAAVPVFRPGGAWTAASAPAAALTWRTIVWCHSASKPKFRTA